MADEAHLQTKGYEPEGCHWRVEDDLTGMMHDPAAKNARMREQTAREIFETEKEYAQNLQILIQVSVLEIVVEFLRLTLSSR